MTNKVKDKRYKYTYVLGIILIATSIILTAFISTIMSDTRNKAIEDTVKTIFIEEQKIPSHEINYMRRINAHYYEIILDNGDVYAVRENKDKQVTIFKIESTLKGGLDSVNDE